MSDFDRLRLRLTGIAYRILGSYSDAEDVVQDTWIAWQATERSRIESSAAYLTRAVSNRALNKLRERQRRREDYIGPWLPEPVDTELLPEERSELADSLSYAMLVLLEQLTPLERAAFVLCEVFGLSAKEAASALESTPEAVRQLTSRARRHLRERERDREAADDVQRQAAAAFVTSLAEGDIAGAVGQLSPQVRLISDGGGKVQAALRPIEGPRKVVGFLAGLLQKYPGSQIELRQVNGGPALLALPPNAPPTVFVVDLDDEDRIEVIWAVRNPDKVTRVV